MYHQCNYQNNTKFEQLSITIIKFSVYNYWNVCSINMVLLFIQKTLGYSVRILNGYHHFVGEHDPNWKELSRNVSVHYFYGKLYKIENLWLLSIYFGFKQIIKIKVIK